MRQGRSNTRGRPPASPILPTNVAARAAALGCRLFAAKSLFVFFFLSLFAFLVLKLRVVLSPDSGAVALPSWGRSLYGQGGGGGAAAAAAGAGAGEGAAAARARPGDLVALRFWAAPQGAPLCAGARCGEGASFFFAGTAPQHAVELRLVELYQMALRSGACDGGGALPAGAWWCAPAGGDAPAMVVDVGAGAGLLPLYAAASGARAVAVDERPHCALALAAAAAASGLGGGVRAVTAGAGAAAAAPAPPRGGCGDAIPPAGAPGEAAEEVPALALGALLRELAAAGAAAGRPAGEGVLLARLDLGGAGAPALRRLAEEGVLGERLVKHWALVCAAAGCAEEKAPLAAAGYVEAVGAWGGGGLGESVAWMAAPRGGAGEPPPRPAAAEAPAPAPEPAPQPLPLPAQEQPALIAPAPGGAKKGWVRPSEEPYVPPQRAPVTGPVKFSSHQV
jgi:hypothetical protein